MNQEIERSLDVLGLGGSPTIEDVKAAFRKLAFKYHPDKCREKSKSYCHERFVAINNARNIIERYYADGCPEGLGRGDADGMDDFKRFYEDFVI
ncbi:MAG: DnaJ domain-containing protein [Endomicrobiales bacterium]|nr:DnaJ domain-containing protein [Endomicrobiales bacterium]